MTNKIFKMSFLFPMVLVGCNGWWGPSCPESCPRGGNDPACDLDKCSCSYDQKGDANHACCVQAGGACWVAPNTPSECADEVSSSRPQVKIKPQLSAQRAGDGSTDIRICDQVEYTWGYFNAMAGDLAPPTAALVPIFSAWEYGHKEEGASIPRPWGQLAACGTDGQVVATNFYADPDTSVTPVTFEAELTPLPKSAQAQFSSIRASEPSDISNCNGPLQVGDSFDDFD